MKPESTGSAEPQLGNNATPQIKDASAHYRVARQLLDVPPGYKRTEVGVIPEDWEASTVGAEFTVQLGKMLDAAKNVGEPKPYIGNRAVQWGRIDLEELSTVQMTTSDIQRFRLRQGDLLVCEGGEIGRAAIWDGAIPECYYQKALHRLRPTRGFNVYLMLSYLGLWTATGALSNYVTQTSIAHLPKDKLETVPLPLSSATEQRAIAEALSDVDDLLGALEALIAKKQAIKQAAMQQLLTGNTRLPGFSGPWETKRLGDVIDRLVGGGTPSRSNPAFWGEEIPWVTVKDFATFNPQDTQESITRLGLNNSASHLIPAGTLITSTRMALGKAVVFDVDVAINQDLKAVFLRQSASVRFLFYWFECNARMIDDLGSGSTVKGISIGQLGSLPFPSLSLSEQTAIATVLSDMDAEIAALERRRDKTRAIKQGMMQQLLTGRVRLL